jgi:photosystem II stability/assembly factor-like uncharacterized protein
MAAVVAMVAVALLALLGAPAARSARAGALATPQTEATPVVFVDQIARLFPSHPAAVVIYAIGDQALFRSQDGGATWAVAGPPPPSTYLAVAADLLLAGDHIPCGAAGGEEPPLSRSADGGLTWQLVAGVAGIRPVAIWSEPLLALATDCRGLLRSIDGGHTWEALPMPDTGYGPTAVAPIAIASDPPAVAALVVSTSEGGTSRLWRADLTLPADQVFTAVQLEPFWGLGAIAVRDETVLLGMAPGVFVSTDAGQTFSAQPIRAGLGGILSVDPLQTSIPEAERGYGVSAVAIDPRDPAHFYAGTADGVYASSDGGQTWQKIAGIDGPVSLLVVPPNGAELFAETDNGVVAVPLQP